MASLKSQVRKLFRDAVNQRVAEILASLGLDAKPRKTRRPRKTARVLEPRIAPVLKGKAPKQTRTASKKIEPPPSLPKELRLSANATRVLALLRTNGQGVEAQAIMSNLGLSQKALTRISNLFGKIAKSGEELVEIEGTGETALWKPGKDLASAL